MLRKRHAFELREKRELMIGANQSDSFKRYHFGAVLSINLEGVPYISALRI